MSLNAVSIFGGFPCQNGKLSEATKRKLELLGIDTYNVTSEAQAQILITNAQQRQQVQQTQTESNSKNTCSSEAEIISKAKNLAYQMGVYVATNENLSEILKKLSLKLDNLKTQNNLDISKTDELKKYQTELEALQVESLSINQNQNNFYTAMTVNANLTKFLLGLS